MYAMIFFKTVIEANVFAFCITFAGYKNINIYKKWLVNLDWPKEISRFENLNLKTLEIQKLQSQAIQKVNKTITITFVAK